MNKLEKNFLNGVTAIEVINREQNIYILEYVKANNIRIDEVSQATYLKYKYFYIGMNNDEKYIDACRSKEYAIQGGRNVVGFEDVFSS